MPKDGAKGGKGSRSSKTARVLSLLTDPDSAAEEKSPATEAVQKTTGVSAQVESDKETQAQIRNALESELLGAAPPKKAPEPRKPEAPAAAAPAPEPPAPAAAAPAPAPVPQPAPAPVHQPAIAPEAAPAPQSAPVPAAAAPAPAPPVPQPAVTPQSAPEPEEEHFSVLNVTQELVEEKADKYIKMFGMCSCQRCRIDVIALALSNLPSKYVVVSDKDINPRLSMYESKYSAAVITQVMSACKKVLEKPHHKR